MADGHAHAHHPKLQHHFYDMDQQLEASILGMWVFLVTEIMFFGGLFLAYIVYRTMYPEAWIAGSNVLNVPLGGLNTAVLICSSLTMALAVRAAQVGSRRGQVVNLILTILLGTHDFSSFENAGSRDKTKESRKGAIRTITAARLESQDSTRHTLTFIGEGFLRHMVRNIVGTLLEVGKGRSTVEEFRAALLAKDRNAGGATAPPHGLKLKKVLY